MVSRTRLATAFLLGAFLAAVFVAPVVARVSSPNALDVVYQPDGRIRGGYTTTWKGDGIYNTDAAHQHAKGGTYEPPQGEVHKFRISIKNAGSLADRFKVQAAGSGNGWRVRYYHGTTNITTGVVAGMFKTPSLAPGNSFAITAKLTAKVFPQKLARLVTLTSQAESAQRDAVKFVMLVTEEGCPPPGC